MDARPTQEPVTAMSCPLPMSDYQSVMMAHGGGGRLSHQLVQDLFLPQFRNPWLEPLHDGAMVTVGGARLALTTDTYVVHPIVFPGGDIGRLAVNGTVNDLAMCGARPLYLTAAFVLEEGFPMAMLRRVVASMKEAAEQAGVALVTGDTKVVDRGKGDGLYINTSGLGTMYGDAQIHPGRIRPGDRIVLSGSIAEHGIAVMSVREGLGFEQPVKSDTAPLHDLVRIMIDTSREVHVLRDPTRGGVASALNELAAAAGVGMMIEETRIPVREEVRGACEILGFDPLYVANEGKLLACVAPEAADRVVAAMRAHPLGAGAVIIGDVVDEHPGMLVMRTGIGGRRVVDMLSGEQLPRIC